MASRDVPPPQWQPTDKERKEATDIATGIQHDGVPEHHVTADNLARKLSARQVQMIAIGGTIGTGLFLGTQDPSRVWTSTY